MKLQLHSCTPQKVIVPPMAWIETVVISDKYRIAAKNLRQLREY